MSQQQLTHPRSILVATNLSDLHRLMPFGFEMVAETGASLELLHVLTGCGKLAGTASYDRQEAFRTAKNMLAPWCERARRVKAQCTVTLREGESAAGEILEVLGQSHADALLLGTRSPGRLSGVREAVLRAVHLPVYTIGPEAHIQARKGRRAIVLVTSPGNGHQIQAACAGRLAASRRAKLILLHVLDKEAERGADSEVEEQGSANVLSRLEELTGSIGMVDIKVAHGKPAEEILAEATATRASLIVMGAGEDSARDRTFSQVLAHAQCPVLSLN